MTAVPHASSTQEAGDLKPAEYRVRADLRQKMKGGRKREKE